jgi:hypothetical protein
LLSVETLDNSFLPKLLISFFYYKNGENKGKPVENQNIRKYILEIDVLGRNNFTYNWSSKSRTSRDLLMACMTCVQFPRTML